MNIYCTYLTSYRGNKLPPFYIGSSTVSKIHKGYQGSVSSKIYKKIWDREIKINPHLFTTKVISTHGSSKEARSKELKFHKHLNVVKSNMYVNRALAKPNGFHGNDVSKEKHPRWGQQHSAETKQAIGVKNKGKIPHNKGIPMPQSDKDKMIMSKKLNAKPAWNKGKTMAYSDKALANMCRAKQWMVVDPAGTKSVITNLRTFCKSLSLNERAMRSIASGKRIAYNGWHCSHL